MNNFLKFLKILAITKNNGGNYFDSNDIFHLILTGTKTICFAAFVKLNIRSILTSQSDGWSSVFFDFLNKTPGTEFLRILFLKLSKMG